ncbi:hypothetical protein CYMTET_3789 [Cymbomonas tetramitiformis]|uniref:Uncharacterized protein n=1 Tax=Cymbomonas tetramitiformis TaxID=36881 RepID=A0AAE0LKQ0_9CHLO|nr:hypothetical protein CYMTET_3789 [Cymbomonas tetramitiformis]
MELGFPEFQQDVVDPAQRARLRWTAVGIVGKQAGPREVEAEAGLVLGIQSASTLEPSAVGGPGTSLRQRGADLTHNSVEVTDIWGAGSGTVPTGKGRDGDTPGCIHSAGLGGTLVRGDGRRETLLCTRRDVALHLCPDLSSDLLHDAATQRGQAEGWTVEPKVSVVDPELALWGAAQKAE